MLGGAAELLRPLLGLALAVGGAVRTPSFVFFGGGVPLVCENALLGGGGGVGKTLITDFARTGGGGVGTGGLLALAGSVDDGRFVVNFDASGAGSIFGVGFLALGSI